MSRNLIFYLIIESRIYFSITIVFEKNENDEKKFPFQYCDIVISIREEFFPDIFVYYKTWNVYLEKISQILR